MRKKRVAFVACFLRISRHFRWLQIGGLHCRPADDDAHVVKTYLSMGSSFATRFFHRSTAGSHRMCKGHIAFRGRGKNLAETRLFPLDSWKF